MDAWNANFSSDVGSLGWNAQLTYTPGTLGSMESTIMGPFDGGTFGPLVSTTLNTIGTVPTTTKIYAQAHAITQAGTASVAFNNVNPLVYISLPASRTDMWNYMLDGGSAEFSEVKVIQGCDDYGAGGWTNIKIMTDILDHFGSSNAAFMWDASDFSNYSYDVPYYRVDQYSNAISEFKRLFAGLPVVLQYVMDGNSGKYKPKLVPHGSCSINFASHTNISLKYIPQKKVTILVEGGWGKPTNADTQEVTDIQPSPEDPSFGPIATIGQMGQVKWGQDTVETSSTGTSYSRGDTIDFNSIMKGKLYSALKLADGELRAKTMQFTDEVPSGGAASAISLVSLANSSRREVLTKIGLPVATLWAVKSMVLQKSMPYQEEATKTIVVTAHESKLFSYGESTQDLKTVDLISRTLTLAHVKDRANQANAYLLPVHYSIVYNLYEDMFSDTKKNIAVQTGNVKVSVGRKVGRMEQNFALYQVNKVAFDNQTETTSNVSTKIGDTMAITDKDYLVMFEVSRTTTHYDPIGSAGFKSTVVTYSTKPENMFSSETQTSDGGGDAGNYNSITPAGPGYTRVMASVGGGEIERIQIPACKQTDVDNYAHLIYEYYKGYYQVTETVEKPICSDGGFANVGDYLALPPVSDSPGAASSLGFITSYSRTVIPSKCTTTRVYKYYEDESW